MDAVDDLKAQVVMANRRLVEVCTALEDEVDHPDCVAIPLLYLAARYAEVAHALDDTGEESFAAAVARVRHNVGIEMQRLRALRQGS
jgi:hypothetical protein